LINTEIEIKDDPLFGKVPDKEYEKFFQAILSEIKE